MYILIYVFTYLFIYSSIYHAQLAKPQSSSNNLPTSETAIDAAKRPQASLPNPGREGPGRRVSCQTFLLNPSLCTASTAKHSGYRMLQDIAIPVQQVSRDLRKTVSLSQPQRYLHSSTF